MTMRHLLILLAVVSCIHSTISSDPEIEEEEIRARDLLAIVNKEGEEDWNSVSVVEWNYNTNLTDENLEKKTKLSAEMAVKEKKRWEQLMQFNWKIFGDPNLKRQFMIQSVLGGAALSKDDVTRLNKIIGDMTKIYSTAKICDFNDKQKCDLSLNPDIDHIHHNSRNENELKHVWLSWRNAVGPHMRQLYRDYVHLLNKAAHLNNFNSTDEMWLFPYTEFTIKDIKSQFKTLWEQLKPLYLQMHAYIRYRLHKVYGDVVSERGPLPAHLLGNVWGQSWSTFANDFKPFPDAPKEDLTESLRKNNYTVEKIFKTAEEFFVSLGFAPMVDTFWTRSVFIKPEDRDMVCHASAWDFGNRKDFRIKMCTTVKGEDFSVVHHEMGHIQYYMEYKDQPISFRAGANPGFHEAVGDLISLSVLSPKHLKKLGLFEGVPDDSQVSLNSLFEMGLRKIPFLPFSYLVDQWRWGVFSGEIPFEDYNCKWWELRENIQGVEPPVSRSEADFDAGSKYHIPASTPYIRYFVAEILQFQFHRALCEKAGEYDPNDPKKPLHLCDIYQNKKAGENLREMLKLGASKPWPEVLQVVTGQKIMDASAILEYFRPLQTWLEKQNRANGVHVGWEKSTKGCTKEN